ncbi:SMI1/KNR4 family protein [Gallaecimonas pentaromativorans]|uniref:SMI1/KNR4 family protein n=1 Tax=Gallaecimonas pentaromativorans TaxID=584787 RepID=UPI0018DE9B9E|nr:SMI1/KNR4 family protein [Gallaecimonas pentaromativorans]
MLDSIEWDFFLGTEDENEELIGLRGATDEEISLAENTLNVRFPELFKEVLSRFQGWAPECDDGWPVLKNGTEVGFRCFYHVIDPNKFTGEYASVGESNLVEKTLWLRESSDFLIGNRVVIADNGGGDYFLLDYEDMKNGEPSVKLLDAEMEPDECYLPVADSLGYFLKSLI